MLRRGRLGERPGVPAGEAAPPGEAAALGRPRPREAKALAAAGGGTGDSGPLGPRGLGPRRVAGGSRGRGGVGRQSGGSLGGRRE